jgi:hypothetical protein
MSTRRDGGVEIDEIRLVDHHIDPGVVSESVTDGGYTIPGQAWTYWNKGPGPGEDVWLTTNEREWSITTGQTAGRNLLGAARALQAHPLAGTGGPMSVS